LITDGNGQTYQTLAYEPWGGQVVDIKHYSDTYDEPYRFTGYEKDGESGLNYASARYYDENTGFISVDPLAEQSPDVSGYHYCHWSPINRVDKDGNTDGLPASLWLGSTYVDMANASASSFTVKGFPRAQEYFWGQMTQSHPEMFSAENMGLIKNGYSPMVDDTWIKYNPTHTGYKGDKLIHHHVDQGRFATGIPEKAHRQMTKQMHPTSRKTYSNPKMRFSGKMSGVRLGGVLAFLNIMPLILDSPQCPIYMFLTPGEGKQNRAYIDFQTNQIYEWSIHSAGVREVRFYEDYIKKDGEWRGTGYKNSQYFDNNGNEFFLQ
jgi:RHS repeat-associated protein